MHPTIEIAEIFQGIDGEVNLFGQGCHTTFVRFAGCNLNCKYCDTAWARDKKGRLGQFPPHHLVEKVQMVGRYCPKVTITGGEPLWQRMGFDSFVNLLRDRGIRISVETNGSLEINPATSPVDCWVVDFKLPSSGEYPRMNYEAFRRLRPQDYVKFVVGDSRDYEEMKSQIPRLRGIGCKARFCISPIFKGMKPEAIVPQLVEQLQKDLLYDVILNVQIHKLLGLK